MMGSCFRLRVPPGMTPDCPVSDLDTQGTDRGVPWLLVGQWCSQGLHLGLRGQRMRLACCHSGQGYKSSLPEREGDVWVYEVDCPCQLMHRHGQKGGGCLHLHSGHSRHTCLSPSVRMQSWDVDWSWMQPDSRHCAGKPLPP